MRISRQPFGQKEGDLEHNGMSSQALLPRDILQPYPFSNNDYARNCLLILDYFTLIRKIQNINIELYFK